MLDTFSQPISIFTPSLRRIRFAAMGIDNDNGRLLKQTRIKKGLTQEALGALLDPPMNKQAVYKMETGIRRIDAAVAGQLAQILGLKPADLADEAFIVSPQPRAKSGIAHVTSLPVLGKAQAGYWAEAEFHEFGYDPDTGESFEPTVPVVASSEYPRAMQYALMLDGNSLNKIAPPNSYVVCVRLEGYPCDEDMKALDGKLVHVERHKGDLIETTVKRLKFNGTGAELWPESHDAKHQSPIPLRENSARTAVQIMGVVIGLYQAL